MNPAYTMSWITMTGADALDFLHRMTTVNLKALDVGHGSPGCFLTPQGKIRSYFTLWRISDDRFAFELDSGPEDKMRKELLAAIDQFTFAEKFTLETRDDLASFWFFPEKSEHALSVREVDGVFVCDHGSRQFGRPWISAWGTREALDSCGVKNSTKEILPSDLELWRIEAMSPRAGFEISDATIPLEAGLVDAVAPQKGCYPGQEVIERISALGSPAKRLSLITGSGPAPALGSAVLLTDSSDAGLITSSAATPSGFAALAYLKKLHAKAGTEVSFPNSSSKGKVTQVAPYAIAPV